MSPKLKQALESLDQAIDRLEGNIDHKNAAHRDLIEKLKAAGTAAAGDAGADAAERHEKTQALSLKLDAVIDQIESVLEE